MENKYESEVRLINYDYDSLLKKIKSLGGFLKLEYDFDDHYFLPINVEWTSEKNLRVRQWIKPERPTCIYFSNNETKTVDGISFKKSLYLEGKVKLFEGELDTCFKILKDLGFKESLLIEKRKGQVWIIPEHNFEVILEFANGFGWTGEIELDGSDIDKTKEQIEMIKNALGLDENNVSFKSMQELFENQVN